jgi:hypothetical protein
MGANMPKQYLPLKGQPIALYSLQTFAAMPEVGEVVVVCDPSYRDVFQGAKLSRALPLKFALPGARSAQIACARVRALLRAGAPCAHGRRCALKLAPRATHRQGAPGLGVQRLAGDLGQRGARGGARLGAPARHTQGCATATLRADRPAGRRTAHARDCVCGSAAAPVSALHCFLR